MPSLSSHQELMTPKAPCMSWAASCSYPLSMLAPLCFLNVHALRARGWKMRRSRQMRILCRST